VLAAQGELVFENRGTGSRAMEFNSEGPSSPECMGQRLEASRVLTTAKD
jgi:hypothetical protein